MMTPGKRLSLILSERFTSAALIFAVTFVILTLGALLFLLERGERDDQRISLINDALWVEQTLRFILVSDQDNLVRLASDIRQGLDPAGARLRLENLKRISPELRSACWRDAAGAMIAAVPSPAEAGADLAARRDVPQPPTLAFSPPHKLPDGGFGFTLSMPLSDGGGAPGFLTAEFSLHELLDHHAPWWVTQKYQVTFRDAAGAVLARKSQIATRGDEPSHTISFDPPIPGLYLSIARFDARTHLLSRMLAAALVVFSLIAVGSLLATRLHMRRRSEAERALRSEHAFRKAMEDSLTVGMRARDLNGCITYVNQAFCKMVGWPAEELIGCGPVMPYWLPEEMERTLERHQAVMEGRVPPEGFEIRLQRRDGERFDALIFEAPLIDSSGRQRGWMASVLDITDRKRAEELSRQHTEKLARTARLVSMGEMASALAHELNQPLAAISSYAAGTINFLKSGRVISTDELLSVLGKLSAQAQRAGQIIQRVRDFVRKSDPYFAPLDMTGLLNEAIEFVTPQLTAHGVTLEAALGPDLPDCPGDRILLEQVLLNLTRNALEAMAATPRERRILSLTLCRHKNENVDEIVVSVGDRGPGVSAEVKGKLFVPYATTKAEGMGMGLNICRTIVELHKGRLWYEDRPGGGALFSFSLPVESAP